MSAQGVFTPDIRVTFVDGQETYAPDPGFVACGAGTGFPVEITLVKLAEMIFRVKDAWYIGGEFRWTISGNPATFPAPIAAPANRALQVDATTYQTRGYTKIGADDFNDALYDAGYGVDYSDIGDNERGMWRDAWRTTYRDAFSYEADDPSNTQGGNSEWWGLENAGGIIKAFRGNRVAVVKVDPANGFYDPTNKFFLEFEFYWNTYTIPDFGGGSNIYDSPISSFGDWSANATQVCNYVMRLYNGDVTCPLYFPTSANPETSDDIIHAAQVWWPYDRNTEPRQIWDGGTGEFVPIAAPVLAFDRDVSDLYLVTF